LLFPSENERWKGADSLDLLARAYAAVRGAGWTLVNADCVLIGEAPRIAPLREEMQRRLTEAIGVKPGLVTVSATSTDGIGFTGRGEGLAAQAVALLRR
jgi:2-C-methyl-D-erythritol 2,4-cyclodiphosphate synthase